MALEWSMVAATRRVIFACRQQDLRATARHSAPTLVNEKRAPSEDNARRSHGLVFKKTETDF
ncbi:MAG: hypothetical protein ACI9KE_001593 [Polyangiales bacterium]|jgi:hypothetical protein